MECKKQKKWSYSDIFYSCIFMSLFLTIALTIESTLRSKVICGMTVESFKQGRQTSEYNQKPVAWKEDTNETISLQAGRSHCQHCPGEPVMLSGKTTILWVLDNWRCSGKVEGQYVDEIVLDTGCKQTMVHQELIVH